MKLKERVYISLTRFLPKGYVEYFEEITRYSGDEEKALINLGSSIFLSFLVGAIMVLSLAYYTNLNVLILALAGIGAVFVIQVMFYLGAYFKMESKADLVEKSLPDQLQLMANNIKSGMTPFKALRLSARDEFGPLAAEIKDATNRALGVTSLSSVLLDIKSRIKSVMLNRVLKLEVSALKTGGNFSDLLNEVADDIRDTQTLRKELVTKTKTYTAFILFTILFGMPVLLAISIQFVELITGFSSITKIDQTASAGFDIGVLGGGVAIEPGFLVALSFSMLIMTTILASMLLGVINKGKATSGLRYAPALLIVAFVLFSIARYAIGAFFGTML